jgi:hypothetical protein
MISVLPQKENPQLLAERAFKAGVDGWTRTLDLRITSRKKLISTGFLSPSCVK